LSVELLEIFLESFRGGACVLIFQYLIVQILLDFNASEKNKCQTTVAKKFRPQASDSERRMIPD